MYQELTRRAALLASEADPQLLQERRIGLEKEALRVSADGSIAQSDHPASLGSALCNGTITTDFSEALLEMVTPPCVCGTTALDYLLDIHRYVVPRLPRGEHLWATSMPCILQGEESIRIGEYGSSHSGRLKHLYRRGLGVRYGRRMQAIAGIHFNFSLPIDCWTYWAGLHGIDRQGRTADQLATEGYFHMTRNLLRIGWIVPYLFGASPAICESFLPEGTESDLSVHNKHTRYAPFGTSLRMGNIGYRYREDGKINLNVRHDSVCHYVQDIVSHVTTEHPPYREIGLRDAQGELQQLNTNRLQIENEYYSSVRPKQIPEPGEMPVLAMARRGIRYLELRSIDVNLFDPAGIGESTIDMLELLLLFAWLADSPPLLDEEMARAKDNIERVAHDGREPGLLLRREDRTLPLSDWGREILDAIEPVALYLDRARSTTRYTRSLGLQRAKLEDARLTPSARLLEGVLEAGSFFDFALLKSLEHHHALLQQQPIPAHQAEFDALVAESLTQQEEKEAACKGSFEAYLANYLGQIDAWQSSGKPTGTGDA